MEPTGVKSHYFGEDLDVITNYEQQQGFSKHKKASSELTGGFKESKFNL